MKLLTGNNLLLVRTPNPINSIEKWKMLGKQKCVDMLSPVAFTDCLHYSTMLYLSHYGDHVSVKKGKDCLAPRQSLTV